MPKTGFFNDNEYRAYPFINKNATAARHQQFGGAATYAKIEQAIHGAIVDAGFIFGVDCTGSPQQELLGLRVRLLSITALAATNGFIATFLSTATPEPLVFTTGAIPDDWVTVKAAVPQEANTGLSCEAGTARWRGYIVAAAKNTLKDSFIAAGITADQTGNFVFNADAATDPFEFEIEPGRVQNKAKSYLRSITVGNFARIQVPPCGQENTTPPARPVHAVTPCMAGPITLEEGYNCQITQIDRTNTFTISARKDAGAKKDAAYCANNGEFPLFPDEEKPLLSKTSQGETRSEFYSGGPTCKELMYTINGVGGRNVALIAGNGITISAESNKIVIGAQASLVSDCNKTKTDTTTP